MSESRWDTLQRLFTELAGASPDARNRQLAEIGVVDPALRTELEGLLRAADGTIHLLDFGIAKLLDSDGTTGRVATP